jgi:hypothetical protein
MVETHAKMTNPEGPPTASEVEDWIGRQASKLWWRVTDSIERNYPGVFVPEWLYGGQKHGWSLR